MDLNAFTTNKRQGPGSTLGLTHPDLPPPAIRKALPVGDAGHLPLKDARLDLFAVMNDQTVP